MGVIYSSGNVRRRFFLRDSGLPYTILHPEGLLNEPSEERELCLGVDDKILGTLNNIVPREDRITALERESYRGRSFDLVSKPVREGVVTIDYGQLLSSLDGKWKSNNLFKLIKVNYLFIILC